jgi:hypothetical protein
MNLNDQAVSSTNQQTEQTATTQNETTQNQEQYKAPQVPYLSQGTPQFSAQPGITMPIRVNNALRRSRFPGKESASISFNLTEFGRALLKAQAYGAGVSNGDYVEMLIRERAGLPPLRLPSSAKQTGPKGGAKSYFFGKNRGTTTAVCVTPMAHRMLDEQVAASRMSRGDYIEFLLRQKAGSLDESLQRAFAGE